MSESLFDKDSRRKARLDAIVTTATKLISKQTLSNTSLDDVANALGVTKPTLYHYVKNKEELIFQCLCQLLRKKEAILDQADKTGKNGREKLELFIREYAKLAWDSSSGLPSLMMTPGISPKRTKLFLKDHMTLVERTRTFIREGIEDSSIRAVEPELLENFVVGIILWGSVSHRQRPENYSTEETLDEYLSILTNGIKP